MPDDVEFDTKDLQDKITELDDERAAAREDERKNRWVRYVGLTTAILAVFAAVAALRSSDLVNEALIHQIKASDTWAEYQAERQKDHAYTVALNALLDARPDALAPRAAARRTGQYRTKIAQEGQKERRLSLEARDLERESADELRRHHFFEYSVGLIQIAIAVGAVSALVRVASVWYVSILAGVAGVVCLLLGFAA